MRVCDLRYSGVPAWPPAWTSSLPTAILRTGGPDAVLRRVGIKNGGLEIEIEIGGELFLGLMLWDEPVRPADLKQILENHIGRSLRETGEAAVAFVYDRRRAA